MKIISLLGRQEKILLVAIIIFSAFISMVNPVFFTFENLFDLLRSNSGMAILAIGVFLVMLSGGIDVSSTAIAIAGQYIAINVLIAADINSIPLAFLISMSVGLALGAMNAVFISLLNLPTLIITLGTSSVFHGLLLELVGTKSIISGYLPKSIKAFARTNILTLSRDNGSEYGLSIFFLILVVVIVITWFILKFTMIGRGVYAVGGNQEAAQRIGFNVKKIKFFVYCYAGVLAGVMGVIHVSLIRTSNPQYIIGSELSVIAAVVLGGARLTGGVGSLMGTMLGVILITILEKNLVLLGLPSYWQKFFIGLVIVIGVIITYGDFKKKRAKTNQDKALASVNNANEEKNI